MDYGKVEEFKLPEQLRTAFEREAPSVNVLSHDSAQ
jgi:hypothetical protein